MVHASLTPRDKFIACLRSALDKHTSSLRTWAALASGVRPSPTPPPFPGPTFSSVRVWSSCRRSMASAGREGGADGLSV